MKSAAKRQKPEKSIQLFRYRRVSLRLLTILLFAIPSMSLYSTDFYVSVGGDDGNDGSAGKPFKTIDRANQVIKVLMPGDSLLFRCGETFYGTLSVQAKGSRDKPIRIGSYGEGAAPVISGHAAVGKFERDADNIWYAEITALGIFPAYNVVLNGRTMPIARFPDTNAPNSGYLTIESHSGLTEIRSKALSGLPDLLGASATVRCLPWIIDSVPLSGNSKDTITLKQKPSYPLLDGYGFFLMNHRSFLTQDGEWYIDGKTDRLYLYLAADPNDGNVEMPCLANAFTVAGSSFVKISGLEFRGSRTVTVSIVDSNNIEFSGNRVRFSAANAVSCTKAPYLVFSGNRIEDTNNNGLMVIDCPHSSITYNTIINTALFPGMGKNADDQYLGAIIDSDDVAFINNRIENTGYIALRFNGNNIRISGNYFSRFCVVKNDGAAVYTWSDGKMRYKNRLVENNLILDGVNMADGTALPFAKMASGIYIDDRQSDVEIRNNFVARCAGFGVNIHNAHAVQIIGNILADNYTQLGMIHDTIAPTFPIRDIKVEGNTLFSRNGENAFFECKSIEDDIDKFGTFTGNRFYSLSPMQFAGSFEITVQDGYRKVSYSFDDWRVSAWGDKKVTYRNLGIKEFEVSALMGKNRYSKSVTNNSGFYTWANYDTTRLIFDRKKKAVNLVFYKKTGKSDSYGLLICPHGKVEKNKSYLLKYTLTCAAVGGNCKVVFRKDGDPYTTLYPESVRTLTAEPAQVELLLSPLIDQTKARIDFEFFESAEEVDLSAISFQEVEVKRTDYDKLFSLIINDSPDETKLPFEGVFFDLDGLAVRSPLMLEPNTALILLRLR